MLAYRRLALCVSLSPGRVSMPKATKARVHCTKKVVHPNSRKAKYLAREASRDEKMKRKKAERAQQLETTVGEKFRWFFEHLHHEKTQYSLAEVTQLIKEYLCRFDEELKEIQTLNAIKGRQGRLQAARQDSIKMVLEREQELFNTCGIELPDLTSPKNVELFKEWNCDVTCLSQLKLRKFSQTCPAQCQSKSDMSLDKGS